MPDPDLTPRPGCLDPSGHPAGGSSVDRASGIGNAGSSSVDPPTLRKVVVLATGSSALSSRVEIAVGEGSVLQTALPLPRNGERIDMFLLEQSIGVGGMGAVFRALDTRLDRQVALKILPPEQANDSEVVQRFYQEGRAAARLDHENIARVYTIGNDRRYHYIAFEYIEGTTVRQRVEKNGPLPVGEAINFTLQIADALVHAAERGVVHRDIKPSNIIVTPHGRAKLVDMGLARRFERGGDDGLTQSGMTLGTFDYISPEQARDPRDVDVRSDLYSLGCTLFHMLSGRPPFPEGTVLQKLIQHQEEAPPEIRTLNPAVPPDLASILVKLMAKDRDRRYQTPEQLMRDLLTVAGSLGLRSVSPEGLVWLENDATAAWEHHLVWGVPALVFALIVSALLWWGRDGGSPTSLATADAETNLRSVKPLFTESVNPSSRYVPKTSPAPRRVPEVDPATLPVASAPRNITVESTEDLLSAIANAPARSVIVLATHGPFLLGAGNAGERPAAARWTGRDLTIVADSGIRPVLRLARDLPSGVNARPALLDFKDSHVTLEGLEFQLETGDRVEPLSAIRVEDSELTIRRCLFRRIGALSSDDGRIVAIEVHSSGAGNSAAIAGQDRPPALFLDKCHMDGNLVGVLATGSVDLNLRDCTLATSEPSFWMDNGLATTAFPVEIRLRHVSVIASASPVFRFEGASPRISIDDSVVAPAGTEEATLVVTDAPDAVIWRGRSNLYARIATYMLPLDPRRVREAVRDASAWKETPNDLRESGSVFSQSMIWAEPDPFAAFANETQNPTRLFRLASENLAVPADVGVRQGPLGTLPPPVRPASTKAVASEGFTSKGEANTTEIPSSVPSERVAETPKARSVPPTIVASTNLPKSAPAEPSVAPGTSKPADLPEMPVMPPGREKAVAGDAPPAGIDPIEMPTMPVTESGEAGASTPTTEPMPVAPKPPTSIPSRNDPSHAETLVLRKADQLHNLLGDPSGRPGLIRVAADADWELAGSTIRGTGSWRIQAEAGKTRPRLRYSPSPADRDPTTGWSSLFGLRSGSLQLEGFDVILPRTNAPRPGRWAAFSLWPGTYLNLVNCTVTIEGDQATSAVVTVTRGDREEDDGIKVPDPLAATVQVSDSLFRVGGDLVDVAAGERLVLEINDALIAAAGSAVHAHGLPKGQTAERLSLTFRKVTARMGRGLIFLQSAQGEPELPVADMNARDSIFATSPKDSPLIRVEGQDAPASMRDRIVWEGHGVGYHQISTYRRDQSAQLGTVPTLYDRPSWVVAVGSRELAAIHGDLKFLEEWDEDFPPWTIGRDDARLANDSPSITAGCDLERIPIAPTVN